MKYTKAKGLITLDNTKDFDIKHILECGQVFNFKKHKDYYEVISGSELARIFTFEDKILIKCTKEDYFEEYFDLKTDYSLIKSTLYNMDKVLERAIDYGYGIRILRQQKLETIISFIISANNNIKRIQNSVYALSELAGSKIVHPDFGTYYAFPTLEQLSRLEEADFTRAGLGYRARQIVKAIKELQLLDIEALGLKSLQESSQILMSLPGVGQKVCDCILLFGYYNMWVFPIDTWTHKIYNKYFSKGNISTNRQHIRQNLVEKFKNLSGYAQQYLFYYEREAGKNILG